MEPNIKAIVKAAIHLARAIDSADPEDEKLAEQEVIDAVRAAPEECAEALKSE